MSRFFVIIVLVLTATTAAWGQANVRHFNPPPVLSDYLTIDGTRTHGRYGMAALLIASVDQKPLVFSRANGEPISLIASRLSMDASFAIGLLDNLDLGLRFPFILQQEGLAPTDETLQTPIAGSAKGSPELGVKYEVFDSRVSAVGLAAQLLVGIPSGDPEALAAEDGFHAELKISSEVSLGSNFDVAAMLGYRIRPESQLTNVILDDELLFGLGLTGRLTPTVEALVSLDASTAVYGSFLPETTPGALNGALRFSVFNHFRVLAGGGIGVLSGYGSPAWRGFFGLEFMPRTYDFDQDTIADHDDDCPADAGKKDNRGCPERDPLEVAAVAIRQAMDNDGDRIVDAKDMCPYLPEDHDGYLDEDGCPDGDNDGDLVADTLDPSPLDPEDWDDFEDIDGTPEPDNDRDGVADRMDKCPDAFGTVSGCPSKLPMNLSSVGAVNITYQLEGQDAPLIVGDTIHPADPIDFEHKRSYIMPHSASAIGGLSFYLKGNPHLARVEIGVHVDGRGSAYSQRQLSMKRAKSVAGALVKRGVEAERLYLKSYGGSTPVASNKTRAGRAKNRRVEIRVMREYERPSRKARFKPPKLRRKKRTRKEKGRKGLINPRSSLAPDQPTILVPRRPIRFQGRQADLSPRSLPQLHQLANVVAANPEFRHIEITVRTRKDGSPGDRLALTRARAEEVRRHLIRAGIEADRLVARGSTRRGRGVQLEVVDAPFEEAVQ